MTVLVLDHNADREMTRAINDIARTTAGLTGKERGHEREKDKLIEILEGLGIESYQVSREPTRRGDRLLLSFCCDTGTLRSNLFSKALMRMYGRKEICLTVDCSLVSDWRHDQWRRHQDWSGKGSEPYIPDPDQLLVHGRSIWPSTRVS